MRRTVISSLSVAASVAIVCSACSKAGGNAVENNGNAGNPPVTKEDVARLLSSGGLTEEHLHEVHNAVSASSDNGYDDEYTMRNIFGCPGAGVGDDKVKSAPAPAEYANPLRELFREHFSRRTKAGNGTSAEELLDYLQNSDIQIFWPESEGWDGVTMPVITFDPMDGSVSNKGWIYEDGAIKEINVSEETALERPVWVINSNDDAGYQTLEILLKNNPSWNDGGQIFPGGKSDTKAETDKTRTLVMKDFTMLRNYDNWFRGASEFFFKIGGVESFKASTQAELKLYNPSVTDFMLVVKRKEVGQAQKLNTVLISEWTDKLESCAFMVTEDDGGEITSWNCSAVVKWDSKSYGFDITLPYHSNDDIVWRGQLTRKYLENNNDVSGRFGDTAITFSIK